MRKLTTILTMALGIGTVITCPVDGLAVSADSGRIDVRLVDIRTRDQGELLVMLHNNEDSWSKPEKAFRSLTVPVDGDSMTVMFDQVPFDSSYGIQVIHDKNKNGKFDMRWFPWPKPKEGGGVSNNHVRRGPPKYDKARFTLDRPEKTLRIQLRY